MSRLKNSLTLIINNALKIHILVIECVIFWVFLAFFSVEVKFYDKLPLMLTLFSLIFACMNLIIIKLNETVYSRKEYYDLQVSRNGGKDVNYSTIYRPLEVLHSKFSTSLKWLSASLVMILASILLNAFANDSKPCDPISLFKSWSVLSGKDVAASLILFFRQITDAISIVAIIATLFCFEATNRNIKTIIAFLKTMPPPKSDSTPDKPK